MERVDEKRANEAKFIIFPEIIWNIEKSDYFKNSIVKIISSAQKK